jgi:hypothetical protein
MYKRWGSMPELKEALEGMRINDEPAVFSYIMGILYTVGSYLRRR